MRLKHALSTALALVLLAGASFTSIGAQASKEPAIGGYCPVAYIMAGKASKGDPRFTSTVDGQTYQLTNEMVKGMFDKEPGKFTPSYKGYCATAVAQGMKLEANPELFVVEGGKAYLFSSAQAKQMFEMDKKGTIAKADANWPKVAKMPVSKMNGQ